MAQEFHSGAEGTVTAAGVDWNVKGFEFTEAIGQRETTNTSHYNATQNRVYRAMVGFKMSASGTFEFDWDANNSPCPPDNLDTALRVGANVPLVLNLPDGRTFNCPNALITQMPIKSEGPDGIFSVSVSWESNGEYSFT